MSKSDPNSAIFMEDSEGDVNVKIKKAFCPPQASDICYLVMTCYSAKTVRSCVWCRLPQHHLPRTMLLCDDCHGRLWAVLCLKVSAAIRCIQHTPYMLLCAPLPAGRAGHLQH
jgi:hypothetical protein